MRKQGLRGQAWVIFSDVTTATAALQAEQSFTFFGKNLKIDYAKEKSDRVAKRDGTFVPKDRKKKRELEALSGGAGDGGSGAAGEDAGAVGEDGNKRMKLENDSGDGSGEVQVDDPSSLTKNTAESANAQTDTASSIVGSESAPPSNILFADSLPKDCNEMMLACLFRSYLGYKEVRIPRAGLAFIEFNDEPHATEALKQLNGFSLSETEKLNLKYGKA